MGSFKAYLKDTSLERDEQEALLFFAGFLQGRHDSRLASRTVMIKGEPGVGKTHIARMLIQSTGIRVHYLGHECIEGDHIRRYKSLRQLATAKIKSGLIFIDDLNYYVEEESYDQAALDAKRYLLAILGKARQAGNLGFLATVNYFGFDDSVMDRIDIAIEAGAPSAASKRIYLKSRYSDCLSESQILALGNRSMGFNFRDMDDIIRAAYRLGRGKCTDISVNKALESQKPTTFRHFDILRSSDVRFSDVIGREDIKEKLREILVFQKNRRLQSKYGLKRTNLLVFHGPPGLGKTHMVKALAGEAKMPIINVTAPTLYRIGPVHALDNVLRFARRYSDTIILIDEADKLVGRNPIDFDGPMQGMMNDLFDGVQKVTDAIVILSMNSIEAFGSSLTDRFTLIEFKYPDEKERELFFRAKISRNPEIFTAACLDSLVRKTGRMSFREIEKIWNSLMYKYLSSRQSLTQEDMDSLFIHGTNDTGCIYG